MGDKRKTRTGPPGETDVAQGESTVTRAERVLDEIAFILGLPISAFEPKGPQSSNMLAGQEGPATQAEIAELIAAFRRIRDARVRRRYSGLLQALADRDSADQ